jgi:hypothetical protein
LRKIAVGTGPAQSIVCLGLKKLVEPPGCEHLDQIRGSCLIGIALNRRGRAMGRIVAFEGLRGVMACWVMFFHIAAFAGMPFANQLRPAVPVDVFILISGFVIAHLVASKREPYGAFIFRRFMRLYPIYLVALVAAIGLMDIYRHIIFDSPLAPFMQSQSPSEKLSMISGSLRFSAS